MTSYRKVDIGLSKKQQDGIAKAIEAGGSVKLKLLNKHLHGKNASFLATKTQFNKIERAKKSKKGVILHLSKRQVQKMKEGGFLPMLLGSIASALIPTLFNRIFPDKSQEGNGFITPANGENTSYHVTGFSSKNAGAGSRGNPGNPGGQGIIIPGTKTARKYGKQMPQQQALGMPQKKTQKLGMGFIDPMSEKFQMLS